MGVKIDRSFLFLAAFPTTSSVLRLLYNKPGGGGGGLGGLIFAGYVPLASQSPYPIIAL